MIEEENALCHYGKKGMKWGIINKDDSEETRLKAQKNVLDYDKTIKKYKYEYKSVTATGRQSLLAVLSQNRTKYKIAREEQKTSLAETRMKGQMAIMAILAASSISKRMMKRKG